jgi:hypothetical protein
MLPWPPPLPPAALRRGLLAMLTPRALRFAVALRHPRAAQERTRRRIQGLVAGSAYARAHDLQAHDDYAAFARKLPVVGYEDLRPWIERGVATGEAALSVGSPLLYERTSGSSGEAKLLPYTPALMRSFSSTFVVWAADLLARGPRLETGRMFFSVSPAFQQGERTPTGVPISIEDDAAYLSPWLQRTLWPCFFVPPAIKGIQEPEAYRRSLAAVLLAEHRLEILSVWSPTYLLALLDTVSSQREAILADLRRGRTGTAEIPLELPPMAPERLALLERDPVPWTALWPALKLLSCWTDASSAAFVPALERAFPGVTIQGKGLLATEAPVTVPRVGAPAPVPMVDEVFLELRAADGAILRLHEAREGDEYGLIVSQAGGLLRYRMGDRVRVEGRVGRTPCLRFLGREGRCTDLAGEKLGEPFVREVLAAELGPQGHCSWLQPVLPEEGPPGYRCVTDHPAAAEAPEAVAARLDAALCRSYHYDQARGLGQLAPLRVEARPDARAEQEALQLARGLRWGDIKFEALLAP